MRKLLLGAAAVALSGCSWFGGSDYKSSQHGQQGYYSGHNKDSQCCVGGKKLSRWNFEAAAGPEFVVGGDVLTGEDVAAVPNVAPNTLSMKNAYDPGMRYELGGSYALNPNRKVTLMASHARAEGEQINLGVVNGVNVSGNLSNYKRTGLEVGLRQYFQPTPAPLVNSIRPYVEGKIGAAYVDDITLNDVQANGVALGGNLGLYENSWVPTAAGMVGVETPLFDRTTLGLETGIRYSGVMKSDTSSLNGAFPFSGANNGTQSWTVPVMLRGRYRF